MSKAVTAANNYLTKTADKSLTVTRRGHITALPKSAVPDAERYLDFESQLKGLQEIMRALDSEIPNLVGRERRQKVQRKKEAEHAIRMLHMAMNIIHLSDYAASFVAVAKFALSEETFLQIDKKVRENINTKPMRNFTRDTGFILSNYDSEGIPLGVQQSLKMKSGEWNKS